MDGKVIIKTELDNKSFESQIKETESELRILEKSADESKIPKQFRRSADETRKLNSEIEKTKNKLIQLKQKQNALDKNDLANVQKNINSIGNGISKTISKVGRWALAVFAIESAYGAVRNAISTLSQYNEQRATDIEYIQFALASMLQPVIERLINLVVKLLQYINYIAKAWFNVNLFGNASADSFKNAQKSTSKMAKDTKEMNKSLAGGIDEITNLNIQDNSSNKDDSGSARIKSPDFNLSDLDGKPPGWLEWIADNKDVILSVIAGISGGLLALKMNLGGKKSLGIGIAIMGVVYAIQAFLEYLSDPSWENFGKIITGIGIMIAGIGIAIGSLPLVIAGAVVAIVGIIISNWEKIKSFLQDGIDWLKTKGREIFIWLFGETFAPLYDGFVNNLQAILDFFDTTFTNIKTIFDNIIEFVKNVFTGNWQGAWENIKNIFSAIINEIKTIFMTVFNVLKNLVVGVGKTVGNVIGGVFKVVVNGVLGAIESILNFPIKSINKLVKKINEVPGINLGKLPTFKLPRLAKGGIVNNPGKGVNMGSYIAGERGAEAILPLQNSRFVNDFANLIASQIDSGLNAELLLELNRNILELADRPVEVYLNTKKFVQETHKDYENETKRLQQSTSIQRS